MTTPGHQPTAVLNWLHDTTLADMPEDVVAFGQRCLLDLLGVAAAGRTTELSSIIHDHAAKHFGAGTGPAVPMLFDGREVSPAGAALASGMTIDSIDAHDGNNLTKGHTGCHQVAAILAFTQAEQKDDAGEFLANLIVGYEIATRAGIALHQTACDYHTSGAWGAVGAAALGARVLGLDHASTFEAMGIAEYHGPRSQMMRVIDHPTMLKDGSGWGAMAGVSAAYLAADGFTGAPAVT
ncbi:MAG: MmgE/PrpD family protein, partial [Acidimicrobiales bacterium]|nr:MmgE/PrpD family protein [Acidimicrobiales bacterium]